MLITIEKGKNMNKRDYEKTNDYKKSVEIL